jgi:alkylation response protein AidB-like acyl-CoA dehydrogenase
MSLPELTRSGSDVGRPDGDGARSHRRVLHDVATGFVAREFPEERVTAMEGDRSGLDPVVWQRVVDLGWPGLVLPEEYGGHGRPGAEMAIVVRALARVGAQTPLLLTAVEAATLILLTGDDEQRSLWLRRIATQGAVVSTALWELPAAYELGSVRTTARRAPGGGYVLSGTKLPVRYAGSCEALLVLARLDDEGYGLFLVPSGQAGIVQTLLRTTNGDPVAEVRFDDVLVAEDARLAATDDLLAAVERSQDAAAAFTCIELLTYAQRGLELTLDYVRQRRQFGRPIGSFQAVHHHCADMYLETEGMRVVCDALVDFTLPSTPPSRSVSIAKAKASTSARRVLELAHQLHGGVGFYTDYPLERLYRRCLAAQGAQGSSAWHRARLVRLFQARPDRLRRNPSDAL